MTNADLTAFPCETVTAVRQLAGQLTDREPYELVVISRDGQVVVTWPDDQDWRVAYVSISGGDGTDCSDGVDLEQTARLLAGLLLRTQRGLDPRYAGNLAGLRVVQSRRVVAEVTVSGPPSYCGDLFRLPTA